MRPLWQVWCIDKAADSAVVVDEGVEAEAVASAERRNATAEEHDVDVLYMALPPGEKP